MRSWCSVLRIQFSSYHIPTAEKSRTNGRPSFRSYSSGLDLNISRITVYMRTGGLGDLLPPDLRLPTNLSEKFQAGLSGEKKENKEAVLHLQDEPQVMQKVKTSERRCMIALLLLDRGCA